MIKVVAKKDSEGNITEISASGHAGYAKHGKDIVCSAVSTLFQSTLIGLMEVVKADVYYKIDDGEMLIRPNDKNINKDIINALLDTLELSLKVISEDYPKYLNVTRGGANDDKN